MIDLEIGHKAWARPVGDGPGLPLLLLHGGPGAGHDYLEPLEALGVERPVKTQLIRPFDRWSHAVLLDRFGG